MVDYMLDKPPAENSGLIVNYTWANTQLEGRSGTRMA